MKLSRILAGAAILGVSYAGTLRADVKTFLNRCTPGAVRACASLQVITTINGSGGTDVTILVRNLQGEGLDNSGGSVISRIGLVTPAAVGAAGLTVNGLSGSTTIGTPASYWMLRSPGGVGGLVEVAAGISNHGPGGIIGCDAPFGGFPTSYYQTCNGGWVALSFTTTNAWSALDSELAFLSSNYAVGGPGVECDTDNVPSPGRDTCYDATLAPEPVTMILLGSGLASMGGFGLVRRRKGTDITTD